MPNEFRLSTRIAIGLVFILVMTALAMIYIEQSRLREAYVSERAAHLDKSLQGLQLRLNQAIGELRHNVLFLASSPPVAGIQRAIQNRDYDVLDGSRREAWEARLQSLFIAFSQTHPDYYSLRYVAIADGGREIVHVDNKDGKVSAIPANHELTFSSRDYFRHTSQLREGQVYLSEFEYPQDPDTSESVHIKTLRASTPVYTPSGKLFGIVILNMNVQGLLESARLGLPADVQTYITNMAGQYLLHPEAKREFVFGQPDSDKITADFPILEQMFQSLPGNEQPIQAMAMGEDKQLFSAARLGYDPDNPGRFLLLMYRIPDVMAHQQMLMLPVSYLASVLAGMALVGLIAMRLLRRVFAPLERLTQAAEQISAGDREVQLQSDGGCEIGALTRAINAMLSELSRREQEILQINVALEKRVEQRTNELSVSNNLQQIAVKESERQTREAQLQLRRNQVLMATARDGIYVLNMFGVILMVNDAFCQMLDCIRDEVVGRRLSELEDQLSEQGLQTRLKSLAGEKSLFESKYRRKDGVLIDVEIAANGVDIDGQYLFFCFCRDITERKRIEAELRRVMRALDMAQDGVIIFHPQTLRFMYVNDGAVQQTGYSRDELLHMTAVEIKPEFDEVRFRATLEPLIRHELPSRVLTTVYRRKDGTEISVEIVLQYFENEQGDSSMLAFVRDISLRIKAEESMRIAAVAFETQDAILITDAAANIIQVNRSFTQITGYSADEVAGQNPRMMSSGRHDRQFYQELWQRLKETGSWGGEIWDKRKNGQIYPRWMTITAVKNERQEVTHYVGVFTDITERKRAEEEIRHLAFYDVLTELPNRRLFIERAQTALVASARRRSYGALLFLDMDRFKILNDTLGHDYGDLMLVEVAKRIKACVREMDTVARLGGDEFVVLIEDVSADEQEALHKVATVAEKIRETLAYPYRLKDSEHNSSPSIGVTLYRGNVESVDELLKHADIAMYQVKNDGRNGVCFFKPAMQTDTQSQDNLEEALSHAIERGEFRLYYQKQVDSEQRPVGAEALLRWEEPQRGLQLPDNFLPVAEASGLILEIDHWVLNEACAQLARWSGDELTQGLTLAVNISELKFAQSDFVGQVTELIKLHRIRPELLLLEPTERMVMDDMQRALQTMQALKALGISLSMDDFGSGYSSLIYLKQLPLDQVKICKSFVQGVTLNGNEQLLVQAVIELGNKFGLSVLAEGVEGEAQFAFLKQHGCMLYQGFLFGKALPINEFEASLRV